MTIIERVLEVDTKERTAFIQLLHEDSAVAIMTVSLKISEEVYIDQVLPDGYKLSDGRTYNASGIHDSGYMSRIIIQPNKETMEEYLARKLRKRIYNFEWNKLTAKKLDAVLKYALTKLESTE